jgi:alkanesulfonate monooxygenase SsuD/methylene tetrahydromethanopterin reductase-like flavin-dependent oxidoreductase (luciferase family)
MRIGLLYDFANPAEWARDDVDLYTQELAQIRRAEALGIDGIWVAEHHFTESYISSPITMLAAIAMQTSRVRIGTSIAITPIYYPIRLAEDLAIIDILSNGRVELGAGLGWAIDEYQAFGVDPKERVSRMREIVEIVQLSWADAPLTYRGKHFDFSGLDVRPKPVQKPHPPIMIGVTTIEGAKRVGRWGLPLMWIDRTLSEAYLEAYEAAGHAPEDARIDGYINLFVCDDPEHIWPDIKPYYRYQAARHSGRPRAGAGGTVWEVAAPSLEDIDALRASGQILVVTPEQAIEALRERTEGLPVTGFTCHNRVCGMPDDLSDRHIELLANVVRPAIAAW